MEGGEPSEHYVSGAVFPPPWAAILLFLVQSTSKSLDKGFMRLCDSGCRSCLLFAVGIYVPREVRATNLTPAGTNVETPVLKRLRSLIELSLCRMALRARLGR